MKKTVLLSSCVFGGLLVAPASAQTDAKSLSEMTIKAVQSAQLPSSHGKTEHLPFVIDNASDALSRLPGVDQVKRGGTGGEPVIRGLGWERVVIQLNGHPLIGAGPGRMDTPASQIDPFTVETLSVSRDLASVSKGAGGTGGRISISTFPPAPKADDHSALFDLTYDGARDGITGRLVGSVSSETVRVNAFVSGTDMGDYDTPDGTTVPSSVTSGSAGLGLRWDVQPYSRLELAYRTYREEDVDFPARPMDARESTSHIVNAAYTLTPDDSKLESLTFRAGYSDADHTMDNSEKPNRMMVQASTDASAEVVSLGVDSVIAGAEESRWLVGVDGTSTSRDALRTRTMVAMGRTFLDPITPDVSQDQVGAYVEWNSTEAKGWRWAAGLRLDGVQSDAAKANERIVPGPGVGMTTVNAAWNTLNPGYDGNPDRDDVLVSGNIAVSQQLSESMLLRAEVGRAERAPNLTELYWVFSPAPGGFGVGNPELDTEKKHQFEVGIQETKTSYSYGVTLFVAGVQDYILPTTVDRQDVNGDGRVDRVIGYRNVDALMAGGEWECVWMPAEGWRVPFQLAYVYGENTTQDKPLPEIPPLTGRLNVIYQSETALRWWVDTELEFATKQDRVDAAFPEDETDGYAIVHLRGGFRINAHLGIEVGITNLFDEEYNYHLTREALMPVGDLGRGQEIQEPGHSFYISVNGRW